MAKAEISWKRKTADGQTLQVYVHHVGNEWRFFARERRFDCWQAVPQPPLDDWLLLLDAVRRWIGRRRLRPEEEVHVRKLIRDRFPDYEGLAESNK
jgi:hypothetical protein